MSLDKPFWWKYAKPTFPDEFKQNNPYAQFCKRKGYTNDYLKNIYGI
jgi:hypothetical protein